MVRRIGILLIGALALSFPSGMAHARIGPLDIVGIFFPDPFDVVSLIDALTRKDTRTSVEMTIGGAVRQSKLLVARSRVDVDLERSSRNWRGRLVVHVTVPSTISYSVDLSKIRPEDVRANAEQRLLVIVMPALMVEDVSPLLQGLKVENTFKRARCKFFDADVGRELQNAMLKEDYLTLARQVGAARIPELRDQGREVVQVFLQRLLQAACPGVRVVVE